MSFQYPVSDRLDCNYRNNQLTLTRWNFQYPVSDRLDCNFGALDVLRRVDIAFSILCRIVWIVTFELTGSAFFLGNFQYPVSDRLDCNKILPELSDRKPRLSVSCVGSSGL